jgi:stress-induced morphogen
MTEIEITETSLHAALTERLKAVHVEVTDISGDSAWSARSRTRAKLNVQPGGCGQSFTTLIVSPEFSGKNSLKRNQLVNSVLRDEISRIHAWTVKCQTPEEWAKTKAAAPDASNDGSL